MDKKTLYLLVAFVLSGFWYYHWTVSPLDTFQERVVDVIDGDTLVLDSGVRVRLLGVNTPEKNRPFFLDAKMFLESLVENKTVTVHDFGFDRYERMLAHVFVGSQHVNEMLLTEGLATLYEYEPTVYSPSLLQAEAAARSSQKNLWLLSSDVACVQFLGLRYRESERCTGEELLQLQNVCDKLLVVEIKDDATHIFDEALPPRSLWEKSFSCVFNDAGDSVYIRDDKGLLIFYRY